MSLLRWRAARCLATVFLRPFGYTIVRDYIGFWRRAPGGGIARTLRPVGWRVAPVSDPQLGTSAFDRLLREMRRL